MRFWGLWCGLSRLLFGFVAKPRGLLRMRRCSLLCCVRRVPGRTKKGWLRAFWLLLLTDRYRLCRVAFGFWGRKKRVWETRGRHRGLSVSLRKSTWAPPSSCVLPRAQAGGVVVVERRKRRAEDRVGSRWTTDENNNTFRGTSMERTTPRLCLALLGRDGPRNGRIWAR